MVVSSRRGRHSHESLPPALRGSWNEAGALLRLGTAEPSCPGLTRTVGLVLMRVLVFG